MSNFGSKITQQEYERRVTGLPSGTPDHVRDRAEFDAQVDYKLGSQVPEELKEKMFAKQMFLRKRHMIYLAMGMVVSPTNPLDFVAKKHVKAFSSLLKEDELASYFDVPKEKVKKFTR